MVKAVLVRRLRKGEKVFVAQGQVLSLECCDCRLVHRIELRQVGEGVELQFFRDGRKTAARRNARSAG